MIITETKLKGAFHIQMQPHSDQRGSFGEFWNRETFKKHGMTADFVRSATSFNLKKHILRGMHFQKPPHSETKLIRCSRGSLYDVIVDLREGSPTRYQWVGFDLKGNDGQVIYIPEGFAHGFVTLEDESELIYFLSNYYAPGSGGGVRWNDPKFKIEWPAKPTLISDQDKNWPLL